MYVVLLPSKCDREVECVRGTILQGFTWYMICLMCFRGNTLLLISGGEDSLYVPLYGVTEKTVLFH